MAGGEAQAQDQFPSKPVTILLGYPPGGSTDTTARAIAPVLERIIGQPVVIQNRPGAAALIGTMQVANATPDGYTITVATTQLSLLPAIDQVFGRPPSFTRDQFAPIALVSRRALDAVRQRQPALEDLSRRWSPTPKSAPGRSSTPPAGSMAPPTSPSRSC